MTDIDKIEKRLLMAFENETQDTFEKWLNRIRCKRFETLKVIGVISIDNEDFKNWKNENQFCFEVSDTSKHFVRNKKYYTIIRNWIDLNSVSLDEIILTKKSELLHANNDNEIEKLLNIAKTYLKK